MPARPTRRRSDPNAGPAITDDRLAVVPPAAPSSPARRRRLPAVKNGTRVTVDVPTDVHRALRRTSEDLSDAVGVHVPIGQTMAALAYLVSNGEDESLRNSVAAYLRERVEQ